MSKKQATAPVVENLNPLTPLRPAEYEALKESIRQRGVMVPVVLDEEGRIIDGFHRMQICEELGIECPTEIKTFESDEERKLAAILLNAQRRQLDDYSYGKLNFELLKIRGVELGRGTNSNASGRPNVTAIAREAGQHERAFYRRLAVARLLDQCPSVLEAFQSDEISLHEAVALAKQQTVEEKQKVSKPEGGPKKPPARTLGPLERARRAGFVLGAHRALMASVPNDEERELQVEGLLHDEFAEVDAAAVQDDE